MIGAHVSAQCVLGPGKYFLSDEMSAQSAGYNSSTHQNIFTPADQWWLAAMIHTDHDHCSSSRSHCSPCLLFVSCSESQVTVLLSYSDAVWAGVMLSWETIHLSSHQLSVLSCHSVTVSLVSRDHGHRITHPFLYLRIFIVSSFISNVQLGMIKTAIYVHLQLYLIEQSYVQYPSWCQSQHCQSSPACLSPLALSSPLLSSVRCISNIIQQYNYHWAAGPAHTPDVEHLVCILNVITDLTPLSLIITVLLCS